MNITKYLSKQSGYDLSNVCRVVPQISSTGFQNWSWTRPRCWWRLEDQFSFMVSSLGFEGSLLYRPPKISIFNPTMYSNLEKNQSKQYIVIVLKKWHFKSYYIVWTTERLVQVLKYTFWILKCLKLKKVQSFINHRCYFSIYELISFDCRYTILYVYVIKMKLNNCFN